MEFRLRPLTLPDDYPRVAELLSYLTPEPTSAAQLADQDTKIPAQDRTAFDEHGRLTGYCRIRLAAVDEADRVIGYATSWRAPWGKPGEVGSYLYVDAPYRGNGVGSALAREIIDWARSKGAARLLTEVRDRDPVSLGFAAQRGFAVERHIFESVLDLTAVGEVPVAAPDSIRFIRIDGRPAEPDLARLYALCAATTPDIPGSGPMPAKPFWVQWHVDIGRPTSFLIAVDGDRWVGVAQLVHYAESAGMYNEYTAVLREYRGRGIASALKHLAVRAALEAGCAYMRTNNDSTNAPMLAINRKMGYQPEPGLYALAKSLAGVTT